MDEKLIDRIRKMHAKAESAKQLGLEAEALAFASAVQKLLLKHNLEMSEVEAAAADKEDPVKAHWFYPQEFGFKAKKQRILWSEILARAIAKAHLCDMLPLEKSNTLFLIGTRQNRQAAEFMIVFLTRYAEEHSEKDYVRYFYECKAQGDVTLARGYKAGWLMGFVKRVAERYEKDMKVVVAEAKSHNPYAMVRLTGMLAKVSEIREAAATGAGPGPRTPKLGDGSGEGIRQGMDHGDKVQLRGMGIHQPQGKPQVGPGQKLLGGV